MYQNVLAISMRDVTVPVAKPTKPMSMMPVFLSHMSLLVGNVTSSITTGMIKARKELASAPMREINRSR